MLVAVAMSIFLYVYCIVPTHTDVAIGNIVTLYSRFL